MAKKREEKGKPCILLFFWSYFSTNGVKKVDGKTLKIERIRADIPQRKMAEALGVDPSLLSKIENNKANLTEDLEKLYLKKLRELKEKNYEN